MSKKLKYQEEDLRYKPQKLIVRVIRRTIWIALAGVIVGSVVFFFFLEKIFDFGRSDRQEYQLLLSQYNAMVAKQKEIQKKINAINQMDSVVNMNTFGYIPERLEEKKREIPNLDTMSINELVDAIDEKATVSLSQLRDENMQYFYNYLQLTKNDLSRVPNTIPVKLLGTTSVSAGFGTKKDPYYNVPQPHEGLDFICPEGTGVFATAKGIVEKVGNDKEFGLYIIINHGNGIKTYYKHLSQVSVRRRQKLKRNDLIGMSGKTGRTVTPHLHYEVEVNGKKVAPEKYLFHELSANELFKWQYLAKHIEKSLD